LTKPLTKGNRNFYSYAFFKTFQASNYEYTTAYNLMRVVLRNGRNREMAQKTQAGSAIQPVQGWSDTGMFTVSNLKAFPALTRSLFSGFCKAEMGPMPRQGLPIGEQAT
jgi:hypothetical protein